MGSKKTIVKTPEALQELLDELSPGRLKVISYTGRLSDKLTVADSLLEGREETIRGRSLVTNLRLDPLWSLDRTKEAVQRKSRETSMRKYGVPYVAQAQEVKDKILNTTVERYGVTSVTKLSSTQDKRKATNQERYGCEQPLQKAEFLEKKKRTSKERYGDHRELRNPKVMQKWLESRQASGTMKLVEGKTYQEIADEIGCSYSVAQSYYKNNPEDKDAKALEGWSKHRSKLELTMQSMLGSLNLVYLQGEYLAPYRPDFVLPDHKLVIECDGLYWHSDAVNSNKFYHAQKREAYLDMGYKPLFFRSDEITNTPEIVKSIIAHNAKQSEHKLMSRKCSVVHVESNKVRDFLNENHLMGYGRGPAWTLQYGGEIVAVLQYRKNFGDIHVSRFCSKLNTSIPGAFSRLLARLPKDCNIVTYIDLRYGMGSYLKSLGFTASTPSVSFRWTDGFHKYHRMKFPGKTGYDHKLHRIWDCGQARFTLVRS